jgi:hypothetical protein
MKGKNKLKIFFILSIFDFFSRLHNKLRGLLVSINLNNRIDSFYFLCPDTYYFLADQQIIDSDDFSELRSHLNSFQFRNIYIRSGLAQDFINEIFSLKSKYDSIKFKNLIFGEDDISLHTNEMKQLLPFCNRIFASNLIGDSKLRIMPIPLGLERAAYHSSGVTKHFQKNYSINVEKRPLSYLVAWNDDTNKYRSEIRKILSGRKDSLVLSKRITPKTLHRIYERTLFIPSPPGNGLDCHRTWEAIYKGAVPVVLKRDFIGNYDWPIFTVDDWHTFSNMSRAELENTYKSLVLDKRQTKEFSLNILEEMFGVKVRKYET